MNLKDTAQCALRTSSTAESLRPFAALVAYHFLRSLSKCCLYMLGIHDLCRLWSFFFKIILFQTFFPCADPVGRTVGPEPPPPPPPHPPPRKITKIQGFLAILVQILKNHKATTPRFKFSHHWLASETPFK